MQYGTFLQH